MQSFRAQPTPLRTMSSLSQASLAQSLSASDVKCPDSPTLRVKGTTAQRRLNLFGDCDQRSIQDSVSAGYLSSSGWSTSAQRWSTCVQLWKSSIRQSKTGRWPGPRSSTLNASRWMPACPSSPMFADSSRAAREVRSSRERPRKLGRNRLRMALNAGVLMS